jgi:hypothetical protein
VIDTDATLRENARPVFLRSVGGGESTKRGEAVEAWVGMALVEPSGGERLAGGKAVPSQCVRARIAETT